MNGRYPLELLERIFQAVFPLVAIVSLGYIYARRAHTDMSVANRINMDLFCPALIFSVMSAKSFDLVAHINLAVGALAVVLGAGLLVWPLCRLLGVAPKTFVPPMIFNNSGNPGIPLIVLAFGEHTLPAAVLNYMVSERDNQEPQQVASIVLISNMASLAIIPLTLAFVL